MRSIILPLYQCATPLSLPPIRAPGRVYQSVTSVSLDDRAITLPARLGYMFTDQVNTALESRATSYELAFFVIFVSDICVLGRPRFKEIYSRSSSR